MSNCLLLALQQDRQWGCNGIAMKHWWTPADNSGKSACSAMVKHQIKQAMASTAKCESPWGNVFTSFPILSLITAWNLSSFITSPLATTVMTCDARNLYMEATKNSRFRSHVIASQICHRGSSGELFFFTRIPCYRHCGRFFFLHHHFSRLNQLAINHPWWLNMGKVFYYC